VPYLIDTDWLIDHLENVPEALHLFLGLAEEGIAVSIISYMEAYQGVVRSPKPQEVGEKFAALMATIPVLSLSPEVARRCARLWEALRGQGKRVNARALDLIIAATALEYGLTLITRNVKDYEDIPAIRIYRLSTV